MDGGSEGEMEFLKCIGTKVAKWFPVRRGSKKLKLFTGCVTEVFELEGFFHVVYTDDDSEDLNEKELAEAAELHERTMQPQEEEGAGREEQAADDEGAAADTSHARRERNMPRIQAAMAAIAQGASVREALKQNPGPRQAPPLEEKTSPPSKRPRRRLSPEHKTLPERVSLRIQRQPADPVFSSGLAVERGRTVITCAEAAGASGAVARELAGAGNEAGRGTRSTLPLCIDNAPPERNAAFVGWVGGLAAARHRGGGAPPACSAVTAAGASHLQLRHQARVTRQPTTQLAFHPSAAKLCLAAGDRGGRLALWRVGEEATADKGAFSGVAVFSSNHSGQVCTLTWGCGAGEGAKQLLSAGRDGSLWLMDTQQEQFVDLTKRLPWPTAPLSAADFNACGGLVFVARPEGSCMEVLDIRGSRAAHHDMLHAGRINSLCIEPVRQQLISTACTGGEVKVWDVRFLREPLATAGPTLKYAVEHKESMGHSAAWAPDGSQRILTIGFDDTVRLWAPLEQPQAKLELSGACQHDTNTGCWTLPLQAIWGADGSFFAVGSVDSTVEVLDSGTHTKVASLASPLMTGVPSRLAAHPCAPVLAAATGSGLAHVWCAPAQGGAS